MSEDTQSLILDELRGLRREVRQLKDDLHRLESGQARLLVDALRAQHAKFLDEANGLALTEIEPDSPYAEQFLAARRGSSKTQAAIDRLVERFDLDRKY